MEQSSTISKPVQLNKWREITLYLIIGLVFLFVPISIPDSQPTERHIQIEASMFQFAPGEIKINKGDHVTIELVSMDVVHGFSLDGYDVVVEADPGQPKTATFIADQPGVFRFRCSVACGNLHPFMIGKLQVGPNLLLIRGIFLGFLAISAALSLQKMSFRGQTFT